MNIYYTIERNQGTAHTGQERGNARLMGRTIARSY